MWNNIVNFVVGTADTLGKIVGGSRIMKPVVKNSLFLVIGMNLFIIVVYFFDFYDTYQLLYIPNLVLLALFCFRNGAAVTYYSIELKEHIGGTEIEEAAGSLFIYVLLFGLCSGSIIALIMA